MKSDININDSDLPENSPEKVFRSKKVIYLSTFPQGEVGTIVDMTADTELQGRLMGMGMFVGTRFKLLQGGHSSQKPLLVAIGETRIALGTEIAKTILVEK
ncbi:MAG: ferrous iron transport protein A [Planctomycetaceae bacterium]|jgi:Fe2+ transport system protein FeoA|nr:ferrous iron transport protein A [Planctomycetaceae bacterium]